MALHLDRGAIDLHAADMDLRQVLGDLFVTMGVDYTLYPEVQGTVSIDLHNATYAQALDLLLGHTFTYTIGPHDVIYVHLRGTTWRPGAERAA